jgi:TRAP-type mannitol/chloroaromatic compound transport system permease small subunit
VQILKRITRSIDTISEWTGQIAMFLILGITFVVLYEVVSRDAFAHGTIWSNETSLILFSFYFLLGGAYALRYGAHVNMDAIYSRLSPRKKAILDLSTFVLFLVFCLVVVWIGGQDAWQSIEIMERSGSVWRVPKYWFKVPIPIGAFLLLLQGLAKLIRDIHIARTGKELE